MGLFDSVDPNYLRRFWYEMYCEANSVTLNILQSKKGIGEYYVAYEHNNTRYLTPFSSIAGQRSFASNLKTDVKVTNVKLAIIGQISSAEMIRAIRSR